MDLVVVPVAAAGVIEVFEDHACHAFASTRLPIHAIPYRI
jgi:hypothetical protein